MVKICLHKNIVLKSSQFIEIKDNQSLIEKIIVKLKNKESLIKVIIKNYIYLYLYLLFF